MGCGFVISAIHHNSDAAWKALLAAEQEIKRIEDLISSWSSSSQTSRINEASGQQAVKVDVELFELIDRSLKCSQLTAGAFDISGTVARYYYQFDGSNHPMLAKSELEKLRSLINYKNIDLDSEAKTVYLRQAGMKIGFGGIGKGYAAQKAYEVMLSMGVEAGLVNASGDVMAWGKPLEGDSWTIHLPDAVDPKYRGLQVSIPYGSVVTSGADENFTIIEGQRYSHIVDPRTALPVKDRGAVQIIAVNPELADALATAVSVLGKREGIDLIEQLPGVECIFTDGDGVQHFTTHLKL